MTGPRDCGLGSWGPDDDEQATDYEALVVRLRKAAEGGRMGMLFLEAADAIEALIASQEEPLLASESPRDDAPIFISYEEERAWRAGIEPTQNAREAR